MPESSETAKSRITVCLKWVPTRPEIDPLTGSVEADDRFSGISPADQAALEWALRVGQACDIEVEAVSVSPPAGDSGLRHAIANGAASAARIDTPRGERADSRAVAAALAQRCRGAWLVFCGDHSLDRGSGSVPGFLANQLGYGQALGCVGLRIGTGNVPIVERRLDQGRRERLAVNGPTVLSFEGGVELRRAPLEAVLSAATAPIQLDACPATLARTGPAVLSSGPYRPRARILTGPSGSTVERIRQLTGTKQQRPVSQLLELDPDRAAEMVLEQLRDWGYLDPDQAFEHHTGPIAHTPVPEQG